MSIYKYLIVAFFVSLTCTSISSAVENNNIDIDKLLNGLDLRHPTYGNKTYGQSKVDLFKTTDGSTLLSYQARYGGDGEHSANILKLFLITETGPKKVLDQNIDDVEFVRMNSRLKAIKGNYIETLCDTCDGWEVSNEADIFKIPITINVENQKITVVLSKKQRSELLKKLDAQINKKVLGESSYKFGQVSSADDKYIKHAESVKRRIKNLLSVSSGVVQQTQ